MSDKWLALAEKLEASSSNLDAAQEVVIGAVRGLMVCASVGDEEAVAILKRIGKVNTDEALQEALELFSTRLAEHTVLSAEARATITRSDLV